MSPPMPQPASAGMPGELSALSVLNGTAIVVAALYFGQELLVPLVLAGLLAFVLAPLAALLRRAWLPRAAAVLLAVLLAFGVIGALGTVVGRQAGQLAGQWPQYQAVVTAKWARLSSNALFRQLAGDPAVPNKATPNAATPNAATVTGDNPGAAPGATTGATTAASTGVAGLGLDGASALALARRFAQPLLSPLATAGVVLVFTLFILLYDEDLRDRFVRLVGRRDLHRTILAMNDAGRRLSRYFLFQLLLNACFGLFVGVGLSVIGLPGAILWGILAALMRFVPFIGTFIALAAPLALAVAVTPGWSLALLTLVLFVAGELVLSQAIEPLIYGHSTGLSPLAIIIATAFWALLWGPVGLLLATPLTVCLVVLGRHVEPLAFFDIIFGDRPPLLPAETFYQRALEGKAAVLLGDARRYLRDGSLVEFCDHVALPGLALAQADRARDALAFERLEAVHDQVEALLAALPARLQDLAGKTTVAPEGWRRPGAVLCIPGRGQLDDLAAIMAAQVMAQAGFGAHSESNLALDASATPQEAMAPAPVRLCCLSVLEQGSSVAAIQYFIRRIQKQMPGAAVVIGLWHADGDSTLLAELRSEGREEHLVLSIGELLAYVTAISAQKEPALA